MKPFELLEPENLEQALSLLDPEDPTIRPVSGGTALMLMMKSGLFAPARLVSLARLPGFTGIREESDGSLRIGAMTTLSEMEASPLVARHAPVIVRAMKRLSNVRVRNVACIGGALAHGDPHMDMPPVLTALGAELEVVGPAGSRVMPLAGFYRGYYETALDRDELIREVRIPAQQGRASYLKCTTRSADDWPALGVAVSLRMEREQLAGLSLVLGAVTETPTRLSQVEQMLLGQAPTEKLLAAAGDAAAAAVSPQSDARGSAAYKRELVRAYTRRALAAAIEGGAR